MTTEKRKRWRYAVALIVVVGMGLGSRRFGSYLPYFVAAYTGDALWAMAAFLAIAIVAPRTSTLLIAVVALAISVLDEVSQLYHAPWIDAIRATRVGALLLGMGFLWSDLVCYAVGVGIGAGLDLVLQRQGHN